MLHRLLRNTHLILGLLAVPMLLVYGASAIQMAHNEWFSLTPTLTESELEVGAFDSNDGRALAQALMDRYGMRGDLQQVKATDKGMALRIVRPGTVCDVDYTRQSGKAKVKTSVAGFMGMLNRLHHLAGVGHDYRLLNVWGGIVAFISIALILLGLSGIYLWFKIYEERAVGAILLAASLGYSLTVMVIIRMG
jgi:hypothetical protein